jgi:hypothetical protein
MFDVSYKMYMRLRHLSGVQCTATAMKRYIVSETKGQGTPSLPEGANRKRSRPTRSRRPIERTDTDSIEVSGSAEATAAAAAAAAAGTAAAASPANAAQSVAHTADDLPRYATATDVVCLLHA